MCTPSRRARALVGVGRADARQGLGVRERVGHPVAQAMCYVEAFAAERAARPSGLLGLAQKGAAGAGRVSVGGLRGWARGPCGTPGLAPAHWGKNSCQRAADQAAHQGPVPRRSKFFVAHPPQSAGGGLTHLHRRCGAAGTLGRRNVGGPGRERFGVLDRRPLRSAPTGYGPPPPLPQHPPVSGHGPDASGRRRSAPRSGAGGG